MEKVKVLAIQMESVIADRDSNIKKIKELIPDSIESDLLILPELWSVGWACDRFTEASEDIDNSVVIKFLSDIAVKYNTNVLGGSFVRKKVTGNEIKYYNTCPVINRKGELVATYDKNHLFSYYDDSENTYITKGNSPVIADIEGIKVGLSICYDIRFPEIYRAYRKSGADILVNMAAWPLSRKIHWDALTCARAVENQTYMIALTQTGNLPTGAKNLGHSMIYDYSGNILSEIETKEGYIYAELNMDEMYDFRKRCTVLKDICESYDVEFA